MKGIYLTTLPTAKGTVAINNKNQEPHESQCVEEVTMGPSKVWWSSLLVNRVE